MIPHSIFLGYVHPKEVRGEFALLLLELGMWQGNMIIQAGGFSNPSNAKARNAGIAAFLDSPCEWLLWIDDDCVVHPTAPQRLRTLALEHGAVAAAGFVATYDHIDGSLALGGWNFDGIDWEHADSEEEAFWVDGVGCHFSLWHRSVYEDLLEGPAYHEDWIIHPTTGSTMSHDLALSLKLNQAGQRVLMCPEVLTWHVKEWKIGKNELDAYNAAHTSP